jgi:hypothetical protein
MLNQEGAHSSERETGVLNPWVELLTTCVGRMVSYGWMDSREFLRLGRWRGQPECARLIHGVCNLQVPAARAAIVKL